MTVPKQHEECPINPGGSAIHINYLGKTGNNLFQFSLGFILSHLTGAPLCCRPIPFFRGTAGFREDPAPTDALMTNRMDPRVDLVHCTRHIEDGGNLVVQGYHQFYEIYRPYKALLRPLLRQFDAPRPVMKLDEDDLVAHVRLGDYFASGNRERFDYGLREFAEFIAGQSFARLIIVTDSRDDPFIDHLRRRFDAQLATGDKIDDFQTMMHAQRLIITPSTFSWWAAWLSDAEEILLPVERGIWKKANGIDLWVSDEVRYHPY
jgi:hypothetical protein